MKLSREQKKIFKDIGGIEYKVVNKYWISLEKEEETYYIGVRQMRRENIIETKGSSLLIGSIVRSDGTEDPLEAYIIYNKLIKKFNGKTFQDRDKNHM
jgi:hypothetical protein